MRARSGCEASRVARAVGDQVGVVERLRAAGCVFAEDEAALLIEAAGTNDELDVMVGRRVAGEPLEYVLGWAEFCGLRVAVERGVFVPRRRTGLVVREAVAVVRRGGRVVDLCCGSGAVGAAVAGAVGEIELHAVDVDPVAVRCARRNVGPAGTVYEGDLYAALPDALRGKVDVIVANAPYVPSAALGMLPPEAKVHEPRGALDGGADGLDVLRRIVERAPEWLAHGGHVIVETSERQAPVIAEVASRSGLRAWVVGDEELQATAVVGAA
jgi:release factor glutamine methyltransferase